MAKFRGGFWKQVGTNARRSPGCATKAGARRGRLGSFPGARIRREHGKWISGLGENLPLLPYNGVLKNLEADPDAIQFRKDAVVAGLSIRFVTLVAEHRLRADLRAKLGNLRFRAALANNEVAAKVRQTAPQFLKRRKQKLKPRGADVRPGLKGVLNYEDGHDLPGLPGGFAERRVVRNPQIAAEPMDDGLHETKLVSGIDPKPIQIFSQKSDCRGKNAAREAKLA